LIISFHGADLSVTGSCHLLECAGKRLLVDCGLYQGGRELDVENAAPFGFDAATIDYVLLTHAHLDHCGRLPLLVKRGFRGEIIATAATRELANIVMLDSGHLQEEEAEYQARKQNSHGKSEARPALYDKLDAIKTLDYFGRTASYGVALELSPGLRATFLDAGHILGSASIYVQIEEGERSVSVAFSGDLGNGGRPLLHDPVPPPRADVVVMETTYGDRLHKPLPASIDEFYDAIADTFRRGGNVVIPTFALERAQDLLYCLHAGIESGRVSRSAQVFLDSPMAISATEIFKRHPECYGPKTADLFRDGKDPFSLPGLHITQSVADSIGINAVKGGAIILAGSGMATGGRVRHHLRHNLSRTDSSIVIVGFAARGTLARQIVDGAKTVHLFGANLPVHARVYTINGFSAHADRDELLAWQQHVAAPRTFLVHGDEDVMRQFAMQLKHTQVELPAPGQSFEL
jgi:metallo-beta-lactamase family protein